MKGEMTLSVVTEPMDHFTTEDEAYLKKLLDSKKKDDGSKSVVLRDDMQEVARDVMAHWYNIKGQDFDAYYNRFFSDQWNRHD